MLTNAALSEAKLDMYEVLGGFDALWTDYSSIYCDFILTEKSVFFFCDDLAEYTANRGLIVEDHSVLTPGPHIDSFEKLWASLEAWIEQPDWYRKERIAYNRLFHAAKPPYSAGLIASLLDR